jgi:hypothetical protein
MRMLTKRERRWRENNGDRKEDAKPPAHDHTLPFWKNKRLPTSNEKKRRKRRQRRSDVAIIAHVLPSREGRKCVPVVALLHHY